MKRLGSPAARFGNGSAAARLREVGRPNLQLLDDALEMDETSSAARDEPETALLLRAGRGDEEAARLIYRANVDRVFRHVARILGNHDPDLDDVVQRVFMAAFQSAERFDGRSKASTWILGIATRRALDEARRRSRRERWTRVREQVGLGRPADQPDRQGLARSLVERALLALTPEQRTVFVLHEVEGHTLAEIRELTGTGISTLHARLKAARSRLDALEEIREEQGQHDEQCEERGDVES